MKIKLIIFMLLICVITFLLTGCWDRKEINTLGIVDSLGIDKNKEFYEVIVEIVNTSGIAAQQGGGEQKKTIIQNAVGSTIFEAIRNLKFSISRKPYFSHNRILIIGEELAKDGIKPVIDFFNRDPELRRTTYLVVAKGKMADIFKTRGRIEDTIGMKISSIINEYWVLSFFPDIMINDFSIDLSSKTDDPFTPMLYAKENPLVEKPLESEKEKILYVEGMAVFKGDRLKGFLKPKETRGVLWIRGEVKGGMITLDSEPDKKPDQDDTSIELERQEVEIITTINNNNYSVNIKIKAEGNIGSYSGSLNPLDPKVIEHLDKLTEKEIKKEINSALNKVHKEYGADVFGFGSKFIMKYPDKKDEIEKDWREIYKNLDIKTEVDFKIRKIGFMG